MKQFIQFIAKKLGYRIARIDPAHRSSDGLHPLFSLLKGRGFAPKHIIDIGANRGNWNRAAIQLFSGRPLHS